MVAAPHAVVPQQEKPVSAPVAVAEVVPQPQEERAFDSEDSDYIPEDESFASASVVSDPEHTEETLTMEEMQLRFKKAVEQIPDEVKHDLDDLLRGRFVGLKKIPRSQWL